MTYGGLNVGVSRGTGNEWNISLPSNTLEWKDAPEGKHSADVILVIASFNAKNKMLTHTMVETTAQSGADMPQRSPANAVFRVPFDVPDGTVRLRVVARDSTSGRLGTADVNKP